MLLSALNRALGIEIDTGARSALFGVALGSISADDSTGVRCGRRLAGPRCWPVGQPCRIELLHGITLYAPVTRLSLLLGRCW